MSLSLIDAALSVAAQGYPVFPCGEDKRPACKNGFYDATTDAEEIRRLFSAPGAMLIGVPTGKASGLIALDVDMKGEGPAWLEENKDSLPATRRHRTMNGGLHIFFRNTDGEEVRNSQGRIAKGVDFRGEGGYVCWPGAGGYTIESDAEPDEIPLWLLKLARKPPPPPPVPVTIQRRAEGGTPYGLAALADECRKINRAGFGEQEKTLNEAALRVGHLVAGGQIQEGLALSDLLAAGYSMPSQPGREPWRPDDVQRKIKRAFDKGLTDPRTPSERERRSPDQGNPYRDDPRDAFGIEDDADMPYDAIEDIRQSASSAARNATRLTKHDSVFEMKSLDTDDFVEDMLQMGTSVILYGPSNVGKSFLAFDIAKHVGYGMPWNGRGVDKGAVLYVYREGTKAIGKRRAAWYKEHGDRAKRYGMGLTYIEDRPVDLVHGTDGADFLIAMAEGIAEESGYPTRLIVIDTANKVMMGADENSSADMGAFIANIDRIKEKTGACVLIVHHSGKDAEKGARGHSSLKAAVDAELAIGWLDEETKIRYLKVCKQRDLETGARFEFKLKVHSFGENKWGAEVTSCTIDWMRSSADVDREIKGHARTALKVLSDLIAERGIPHPAAPGGAASVPDTWWKERFSERAMPGADIDEKRRSFRRAADTLLQSSRIATNAGRVWLVRHTTNSFNRQEAGYDSHNEG